MEEDKIQQYFDGIKAKVSKLTADELEKQLKIMPSYIETALENGQTALANKLKLNISSLVREKVLLKHGISKAVFLEDIVKYIDSIPNHYVKFCEIEYFPRVIPAEVSNKLKICRENELFDAYYVLFTDYTDEEILTEEQKDTRKKNKDPILFGSFKDFDEKYYFIADWIDEYCDITFQKLVEQLSNLDPNYKPSIIVEDNDSYINRVLKELKEIELAKKKREEDHKNINPLLEKYIKIKGKKSGTLTELIKKVFKKWSI